MKKSKRILSIILSLIMVFSVVGGSTVNAIAATKSDYKDLKFGRIYARATISSVSSHVGSAITVSKDKKTEFYYLYAAVFGNRCNKNGDNIKYVSGSGKTGNNAITTNTDILPIIPGTSTDYYAKIASAHIAQKTKMGSKLTANLTLAY